MFEEVEGEVEEGVEEEEAGEAGVRREAAGEWGGGRLEEGESGYQGTIVTNSDELVLTMKNTW